jgi:hypothetical protein
MENKAWWRSRTIWINLVTAAIELSGVLSGIVGPGALQLTTNALNIVLRFLTNQGIGSASTEANNG